MSVFVSLIIRLASVQRCQAPLFMPLPLVLRVQIVVSEDGACGMNYEHSVAEGIALVQLVEHALNYL